MVNFFKRAIDSAGNMKKSIEKKRYEREYVLSNIVELKDTVEVLSETMLALTQDMSILIKLHERLIGEIRAQNDILKDIVGNNLTEVDEKQVTNLINSLKASTDGLITELKSVEKIKEN